MGFINGLMDLIMQEDSEIINFKVKAFIYGLMIANMMDIGKTTR